MKTNDVKTTIVFLGDSVTEGCFELYPTEYGFDTFRRPEKCFATKTKAMLEAKYGAENIKVINAGISGDSTLKALNRFETDVLPHSPDIVVTATGLNDIFRGSEGFETYYRELSDKVKACGAKQIVMTPNMMNTYVHPDTLPCSLKVANATAEKQNNGTLDAIADTERNIAAENGAAVCDVYLFWKNLYNSGEDTTVLLSNYINHPNEKMHETAAKLVFDTIVSLLEKTLR